MRLADGSVRYFSVREFARLQTFPDRWILGGSWTEAMRHAETPSRSISLKLWRPNCSALSDQNGVARRNLAAVPVCVEYFFPGSGCPGEK